MVNEEKPEGSATSLWYTREDGQVDIVDRLAGMPCPEQWLHRHPAVQRVLHNPLLAVLAAAVFAVSPWLVLDIVSAAILGVLLFFQPRLAPALVTATLPFFLRTKGILGFRFSLPELFTWMGVTILVVRLWLGWLCTRTARAADPARGPRHRVWFDLDLPLGVFLAVAVLATLRATWVGIASTELRVVFLDAGLFYILVSRQKTLAPERSVETWLWPAVDGLALGAGAVAVIALAQAFFGADIIAAEGVGRVRALYGSPNNLALYLERVLPLLAVMAVFGRGRRRMVYAVLAAVTLPALVLTFSRGALLLGLPAALLFVGIVRGGRTLRVALAGLGVGLLAAVAAFSQGAARLGDLLNFESGTSFLRLKLWRSAVQMALDHPWLGVGPDNFLYLYRTRYVLPSAWQELNLSHPHNIVLDFWTRLGLAGLLSGAWLLAATATAGWRQYRTLVDGPVRWMTLGLLAGLVAGLAHGLVDNSLFLVDLSFFFFLCAGLFARHLD